MAIPTIESVFPANLQAGVVLGVPIEVVFDTEIDPTTVARAFILDGPDSDRWTGPDMVLWDRDVTPDVADYYLNSPGYQGIVQGTFTYEKLTTLDALTASPTYSPGVSAFKTKVIFTPTTVLGASTTYTVHVAGDESSVDTVRVGVASRTVGDTELGSNLGAGTAVFRGGYTGTTSNQYVVQIAVAGAPGTGQYSWWRTSNPLDIRTGTVSGQEVHLTAGVYLSFVGTDFRVGDTFTANVSAPQYMVNSSTWTFTTGSGSITTVPSSTSTSVLGDVGVPVAPTVFGVASSNPISGAIEVDPTTRTFTITFTKNLGTVTPDQVVVNLLPVLGAYFGNAAQLNVPKILSVNGKVLTIQI